MLSAKNLHRKKENKLIFKFLKGKRNVNLCNAKQENAILLLYEWNEISVQTIKSRLQLSFISFFLYNENGMFKYYNFPTPLHTYND